jgi:predicted amidohydrolase YtcJ
MWVALTRRTEQGGVHQPQQRLSRQQAIRFYTINNARLNFEESIKGSLEPGKYADLIVIDRDILSCPVEEIRSTKVWATLLGGKVVWQAEEESKSRSEPGAH